MPVIQAAELSLTGPRNSVSCQSDCLLYFQGNSWMFAQSLHSAVSQNSCTTAHWLLWQHSRKYFCLEDSVITDRLHGEACSKGVPRNQAKLPDLLPDIERQRDHDSKQFAHVRRCSSQCEVLYLNITDKITDSLVLTARNLSGGIVICFPGNLHFHSH